MNIMRSYGFCSRFGIPMPIFLLIGKCFRNRATLLRACSGKNIMTLCRGMPKGAYWMTRMYVL